jgi:FtsH-binding integral membrane protein
MQGYGHVQTRAQAQPSVESRARFISRTYNTLFLAILAFTGIEVLLFTSGLALTFAQLVSGSPLLVFGGFMLVSWIGSHVASTAQSKPVQYLALASFVGMYALLFVPILYIADTQFPGAIQSAAVVTLVGFAGLTAVAFTTRKDFSFLGGVVRWGFVVALVLIIASLIFGFHLGTFFSVAMIGLSGAAILYDTSNILRHFPEDRHVAGALHLFSSVAVMFFYILRLFMASRD